MDTKNLWLNNFLGYPNGFQLYDFPMVELTNVALIRLLGFFFHNYALVLNTFYCLSFLLTILTSLYVCEKIGLNRAFSLLVSVLFVFAPYHFLRGEDHLFLSAYYAIPIYTLIATYLSQKPEIFFSHWRKLFLWVITTALITSTGVYYAFFACYFFCIAGIFCAYSKKSVKPIGIALFFVGCIVLTGLLNLLPTLIEQASFGINTETGQRSPIESEIYGLKIIQLLLPSRFNGFSVLHNLSTTYNDTVCADFLASLGTIGSIGFIFLLGYSLFLHKAGKLRERFFFLGTLNLSALLLATVGGFGTIFAYSITPMIRCYNRISIFILYFSLLAVGLICQTLVNKYCSKKATISGWIIALGVLFFGFYDQVGSYQPSPLKDIIFKYRTDENFINQIELIYPNGAAIFQLPYVKFPESNPVFHMPEYNCFRGYLHSKNLQWSCGAMKGRAVAQWQEHVSQMPLSEFLKNIILIGFSGLYIDRDGYEDHGKALESQLKNLLQKKPLVSPTDEFAFFDLRAYAATLASGFSPEEWSKQQQEALLPISQQINWGEGFYNLETNNALPLYTWRWSNQQSVLSLCNTSKDIMRVILHFQLKTVNPYFSNITLKETHLGEKHFLVNKDATPVDLSMQIPPGCNTIEFSTNAPRVDAPADPRILYFSVDNFSVRYEK